MCCNVRDNSNNCKGCIFGASSLGKHLKSHTNANNAILMASSCDIWKYTVQQSHTNVICVASFWPDRLGNHLKTGSVEKSNKCNIVTLYPHKLVISGFYWEHAVRKCHINAINVIFHPFEQINCILCILSYLLYLLHL